jgi:hypothetical protein
MKTQILVALVSVAALGACVTQADDVADDSVSADPRLATNGLVPTAIHSNGLNAQVFNGFNIAAARAMEDTADHRLFTSYLSGCALASNQCVASTYNGVTYNYCGVIGLAPAWTTRALTAAETAEVSACVIARANLTGLNVTVSIRGEAGQLATTTDEAASYNVEEAAFYGDVFTSTAGAKHACNGVDQVRDGDTYGDLANRQCGQEDPNNPGYTLCGFVFDGNCSDICVKSGDHYTSCGTQTANIETVRLYGTAP